MRDTITIKISIPPDADGYVLLQCQHCGSFFKAAANDIESDEVLNIYCPSCGLISENYYTDDVIELARAKALNVANDIIHNTFKNWERHNSPKSPLKFKAGKKPKDVYESPIRSIIDNLEIKDYPCCNRSAKINPLIKMSACYCPCCGVISFDDEQN